LGNRKRTTMEQIAHKPHDMLQAKHA
jgi:hypothetical protein